MTMEALNSGEPPYTQRTPSPGIKRASSGKPQLFEWRYRIRTAPVLGRGQKHASCRDRRSELRAGGGNGTSPRESSLRRSFMKGERLYRMLFDSAGDAIS